MGGGASQPENAYNELGECNHLFLEKWDDGYHCCDCRGSFSSQKIAKEDKIINDIRDQSTPADGVNRGVTIKFLVDFANEHDCWEMTTRDVRRKFVMPETRDRRCRYVELKKMKGITGRATTFVSHTWGGKFGDLVTALCDGFADQSRVVWVDIFAVRQWPSHKPDLDFSAVVKQCQSFLIVCSSQSDVVLMKQEDIETKNVAALPPQVRTQIAFLRVWCLVEVHAAILSGAVIVMKSGRMLAEKYSKQFITDDKMLTNMAQFIDINSAEATVPSDKARILRDIESSEGGIDRVNTFIRKLLSSSVQLMGSSGYAIVQCAACDDQKSIMCILNSARDYIGAVAGLGNLPLLKQLVNCGVDLKSSCALSFASIRGHEACVSFLIDSGAPLNNTGKDGKTELMHAAENGHVGCINILLNRGADINLVTSAGLSALYFAIDAGDLECSMLLVSKGAVVYKSAILTAASRNHSDIVKWLLTLGCDPNYYVPGDYTPLMHAIKHNNGELVRIFLSQTCSVINVKHNNETPFLFAARLGRFAIMHLLIDNSCNVNLKCGEATAIMYLAKEGQVDLIRRVLPLTDNLSDTINTVNTFNDNMTALLLAAQHGHVECMRVLLDNGANIDAQTKLVGKNATHFCCNIDCALGVELLVKDDSTRRYRALHYSVVNGRFECAKCLLVGGAVSKECLSVCLIDAAKEGRVKCVELLVQYGADVHGVDKHGHTALIWASSRGHFECVELLVRGGSNVLAATNFGYTPIIAAADHGHLECVKILVGSGSDLNIKQSNGSTALMCAAQNGHIKCVEFLLAQVGCDINAVTIPDGLTALALAAKSKHKYCVEALLGSGCDVNLCDSEGKNALRIAEEVRSLDCSRLIKNKMLQC